jgi:hypothetical protein
LEDAPSNEPANNTLLCELFAYADPRFPLLPVLLDTTVDVEHAGHVCKALNWDPQEPAILHIVRSREEAWLLSPVLGIGPEGCVFRYPMSLVDVAIERTIDLRLPNVLQWFLDVFVSMEVLNEGHFVDREGKSIVCMKGDPPETVEELLPTILAQTPGGGSTFIQGIGACLRSIGAEALIYPSARADSRSVTRNGNVEESFGYVLVDYRDAPPCPFEPFRYFGALPTWRERATRRITVTSTRDSDLERLEVTGIHRLQQYRYAVFHDWTLNSLSRVREDLHTRTKTLGDPVQLAIRRPSDILGQDSEKVLGADSEFVVDEGGPVTGFLVEWRLGPYNSVAGFLSSVLPAAQSEFWEERWAWDGMSWFLHRLCRLRPWVILKCPVCLDEYFWNVPVGSPAASCFNCDFTHAKADDGEMLKRYVSWGQQVPARDSASDPGDITIYSAVCERHADAITGVKPPAQPHTFGV